MSGIVTSSTQPGGRTKLRPPDKGSFPLDHDGECKDEMKKYMKCLSMYRGENTLCRDLSMTYLKCRMENNLMKKEGWKTLGYADLEEQGKTQVS